MKIEFVIPTFGRPDNLKVILASLQSQTNPNWIAHVVIDGITNDYKEVKDWYQNEDRVKFTHLESNHNDWGHTPRNYGMEHATEEWVVMTGDDNYYVPTFVEEFLKQSEDYLFIYCDLVHNLALGGYQPIKSQFLLSYIDIGNFMVRRKLGKNIKLKTELFDADFVYVMDYINKYIKRDTYKIKKINKVLYVHN